MYALVYLYVSIYLYIYLCVLVYADLSIHYDILEKQDIFLTLKENLLPWICDPLYSSHCELEPNDQLVPISYLFRVDWDVLRSSGKSRILLHCLHSTNCFKASRSMSYERPGLRSSHNDVSPERNVENQFRIWRSKMTATP